MSLEDTILFSFLDPSINKNDRPKVDKSVRHFEYYFYDQESGKHVDRLKKELFSFLQNITDISPLKKYKNTVFQCHLGTSRSTACCYVALAEALGPDNESLAFKMMLKATNKPWPNLMIVQHADTLMGKKGRLVHPAEQYLKKYPNRFNYYQRLNRRRGFSSPIQRFES